MIEPDAMLELRGVCKHYRGAENGRPLAVLAGVDLAVCRGEAIAIVGPSGAGKSTLLNIVGTLDNADSGEVLLAGRSLNGLTESELAAVRNARLGFVFQAHHLLPQCNVLENVLLPTLAVAGRRASSSPPNPVAAHAGSNGGGVSQEDVTTRARRLLERVGLSDRLDHRPGQLSGGERQRVAVVRALINQPALLLADEPTGALDAASADNLSDLLATLHREDGLTMIVVTHSSALARRMDRVLELRGGHLNPIQLS